MAFRVGPQGHPMWPECRRFDVAAITYYPLAQIDLSKFPPGQPKDKWAELSPPQKYSLRKVAYDMRKGDVIYAKEGAKIVGRGIVKSSYQFDKRYRIIDPNGTPWAHQVRVEWASDFVPIRMSLGDQQRYTVRELTEGDIKRLGREVKADIQMAVLEGEIYVQETAFRRRNAALIQAKKANSDYCCEICGFSFEKTYGKIGREHIIAHHIKPLSRQSKPSKTTLEDIILLCANCHAMVHAKNPPIMPHELRRLLRHKW
jgi:predicted HNH restriction endonuclease